MILKINNLSKSFGDVSVLNDINLILEKGLIYTLRGGNGSGKTTLINIISGFLKSDRGNIEFKGQAINNLSPNYINRLGIGRTFQDLRLAMQLSVYENILLAIEKKMFAYPIKSQIFKVNDILEKISLSEKRNELAGEISFGQQKLLTIGCCIANNAELLLIDEPVAGVDAVNIQKLITLIMDLKQSGKTILQIEHNLEYIQNTSDAILEIGKT